MNSYIQYTVKGLNTNVNGDIISLSYMKTSKAIPFNEIQSEVLKSFNSIQEDKDVILFINKYGSILKKIDVNIKFEDVKNEAKISKNINNMITLLKNTKEAYDLMEKLKNLDLDFLKNIIEEYIQRLGQLDEYNKYDLWKEDEYKVNTAINELLFITKSKYEIKKEDTEEYIFVRLRGIPLADLKEDVYYILNTLFTRILSNITLQTYYIENENTFRNVQKVNTLLEAIYLSIYNSLDTDNPIRNCNNPNCNNIIINENIKKQYCCNECRNRYNKNKNSNNPIELCINRYRERAYNAYCKKIIDDSTQKQINLNLLNKRNKLKKDNIQDIRIYEQEFNKILEKYIKKD